ncbi:MAG: tRNA (cytidine(56)-2'-O)-methyltransferase [Candidatus ainarchaeum sp.]|jgi:tRNA (cytidine56-2'-O)-methyltransferase|nr:tRNA (cytidine(56)-2'-O)-methyltransferase [Candidatus ainarchaeum sp.]
MIKILKLDHRPLRDKRITTHCALVSRAFNADEFYYSGIEDNVFEKNIISISDQWGGKFNAKYIELPETFVDEFKGVIIHLTMYGEQIVEKIEFIKKDFKTKDLLIIVGGPKVDKFYYQKANYNISVTNQPHSEVAALAIILNFLNPTALYVDKFKNNKIKLEPAEKGKKVISLK